jgi:protein transport protein SEC24
MITSTNFNIRTYINPWVQFLDSGSRWKCNLCYLSNDVPAFFDWDPETKTAVDRMKRAELTHAVVEFVAPQEYMVRPPQPVAFLFLIDVSFNSISTGIFHILLKFHLNKVWCHLCVKLCYHHWIKFLIRMEEQK